MSPKIQILSDQVSQAIAAGEVVERPASVVKELMENAIDAGSTEVTVELRGGGLQLIRVSDNGVGMDSEDAPLALQRYATSKLRKIDDLYDIRTLGFRGEALPSIASVSKMTIRTRVAQSLHGTKILCEGGNLKKIEETGCPVGTEVEVRDLFYNIPVKRKFTRSVSTELRHALSFFLRLSLSHPSISFRLIHDGRLLHEHFKSNSLEPRLEAIWGQETYRGLRLFQWEDAEIKVSGYASLPTLSKKSADGITLFLNQRWIRDRFLQRSILDSYRHVIPAGRFPVVILFLTLSPSAVDVNVHPTKAEVKFKDPGRVFEAISEALRETVEFPSRMEKEKPSETWGSQPDSKAETLPIPFGKSSFRSFPFQSPEPERVSMRVREDAPEGWEREEGTGFRILGEIQGTYLLCEEEGAVIFIDQHAAHERILFERYKRMYESQSVPSEKFLIPLPLELSAEEFILLTTHLEAFHALGFEVDIIGERMVALRAVPSFAYPVDAKALMREVLEELSHSVKERIRMDVLQTVLITLSCHSAIRGNSPLRREEMEELVRELASFPLSATCPHGRPIFFVIRPEDLAKQFRRNVKS